MKRPPVVKKKATSPSVFVVLGVVMVVIAVVAWRVLASSSSSGVPVSQSDTRTAASSTAAPSQTKDGSPLGSFDKWEPEFSSPLWMSAVGSKLNAPPFLFESAGALVKEVENPSNRSEVFRALLFDRSGEVQGANIMEKVSGKPNFDEILLEYVQTFVYSLLYNPTIKCDARGRALVLGLGAGTMASVIHSHLENYIVDVFEVSEDVRRAAEGFLGTPTNDDRFKLHMRDAALAFEGAPANLKYDLIVFDAYMPGPRMPDSLVTQEYISLLASRLTPSGVFVLNFCLPYYNMDAQIEIMERYRKAYKHLHFLEATPTSRIVIGYNFSRARSPSDVLEQHLSMHESSCHWPGTTRAAMYEVYLPAVNWHSSWRRFPHNEATEYYCTQELRVDRQYCSWFLKRDKLWKLAPEAHFASMEQEHALREAKGDVKLAAQIARRLIREKKEKSGQN